MFCTPRGPAPISTKPHIPCGADKTQLPSTKIATSGVKTCAPARPTPARSPVTTPVAGVFNSPVSIDFFFITGYRLFVVGTTAIVAAGLYLLLRYTMLGMRIPAGTSSLETTLALGVNIYKLRAFNARSNDCLVRWLGSIFIELFDGVQERQRQAGYDSTQTRFAQCVATQQRIEPSRRNRMGSPSLHCRRCLC